MNYRIRKKEESLLKRDLYQLEIRVIHILLSARYEEKEIEYLYQQYNDWEKKTNKGVSNKDIHNLKKRFALLYFYWGIALRKLSNLKTGEEKEKYLQEACKKFEKAVELKSDDYINYMAWGITLRKLSELKTGKEKEQLKHEVEEKVAKAQEVYDRTLKEKQSTSGGKTS